MNEKTFNEEYQKQLLQFANSLVMLGQSWDASNIIRAVDQIRKMKIKIKKLKGQNKIQSEFLRTRQCPDHSGKWEQGRCLQCEIEHLRKENQLAWNTCGDAETKYNKTKAKLNNLIENLEGLPRYNNLTGGGHGIPEFGITGDMSEHPNGLWIRRVFVDVAIEEAKKES